MKPVITFTTWTKRMPFVEEYIKTNYIDRKLYEKYTIVMNTWKGDEHLLSENIKEWISEGLIYHISYETDIGSHKKYLEVFKRFKNNPIILVDDDAIYSEELFTKLLEAHKNNPNYIIGSFGMIMDDKVPHFAWQRFPGCVLGRMEKFTYTNSKDILETPRHDLVFYGVGGVLYPPNCFTINEEDIQKELKEKRGDDFLLTKYAVENNLKRYCIKWDKPWFEDFHTIQGLQVRSDWYTFTQDLFERNRNLYEKCCDNDLLEKIRLTRLHRMSRKSKDLYKEAISKYNMKNYLEDESSVIDQFIE